MCESFFAVETSPWFRPVSDKCNSHVVKEIPKCVSSVEKKEKHNTLLRFSYIFLGNFNLLEHNVKYILQLAECKKVIKFCVK